MKKLLLALSTAVLLLCVQKTFAAPATPAVTITPFLQEVKIKETDETKTFYVNITNNDNKPQTFKLSVVDFGSLDNTGGIVYAGSNSNSLVSKYGLVNWLKLDNETLSIAPGKTAKVEATITNDNSMQPGGHYAAIIASVDSPTNAVNKISINQRLSSLIFATKMGGEKYDLKLGKIYPETSLLHLPKKVNLHFSNPGNVHVIPRGVVQLVAPNGKVIEQGVINEASSFVLPGTTRILNVELRPLARANLLPANYRLVVKYRYDGIDQNAVKTVTVRFVNIFPLLMCFIFVAAVCGVIVWQLRLMRNKKNKHKNALKD